MGVELLGGLAPIDLLAKEAGTSSSDGRTQARNYERHWTPTHLDFVVEDIAGAVQTAVAAGARLEKPIASRERGQLAATADPFDYGFCFVQFLGSGYDEITAREA